MINTYDNYVPKVKWNNGTKAGSNGAEPDLTIKRRRRRTPQVPSFESIKDLLKMATDFEAWKRIMDQNYAREEFHTELWNHGFILATHPANFCELFFSSTNEAEENDVLEVMRSLDVPPLEWLAAAVITLKGKLAETILERLPRKKWQEFLNETPNPEVRYHLKDLLGIPPEVFGGFREEESAEGEPNVESIVPDLEEEPPQVGI